MGFFALFCFFLADIESLKSGNVLFLKNFYNFLILYSLILTFVVLIVIPAMLLCSTKVSYEFTVESIYRINGKQKKLISNYISIEKIVLLEGLLIDVWYKNSLGIRDSFRIFGLNSKQEIELVSFLRTKKGDITITNRIF